jgi:methyl-accepting chemotaxis protein PixJ
MASSLLESDTSATILQESEPQSGRWWQRLSLKTRVALLAIVMGITPALLAGGVTYLMYDQTIERQIVLAQTARTSDLATALSQFLGDRYRELDLLSTDSRLTNADTWTNASVAQKQAILDQFQAKLGFFDSLAFFDPDGKLLFKSKTSNVSGNYGSFAYIQAAKATGTITLNSLESFVGKGQLGLEYAVPVKQNGQLIGVIRAHIPASSLRSLLRQYENADGVWYLTNRNGTVIATSDPSSQAQSIATIFPQWTTQPSPGQISGGEYANIRQKRDELVTYTPVQSIGKIPDLQIGALLSTPADATYAPLQRVGWTLFWVTLATVGLVSAIAALLAQRVTQPITEAADAIQKLGQGHLDTRITVEGHDEVAALRANINRMAEQIQAAQAAQDEAARQQLATLEALALQQAEYTQQQLAAQAERVQQQSTYGQQQQQQREQMQQQLVQLLESIEGAVHGDLTVRADILDGEIGTVADFFNAIIESLRQIVSQVKQSTQHVNDAVAAHEISIRHVAQQASQQAQEVTSTLKAVAHMERSTQAVAAHANQAAQIAQNASGKAVASQVAMDQTTESIFALRDIIADTAKKVKRLGESSQQISKVVALITQLAMKTKLLAINASIEAALAGESGQGFAVVAEEVGQLAAQSTAATKEVEQLVDSIQRGTSDVVSAMEAGTAQVVESTQIVNVAKQNLEQILGVSQDMDGLVQLISAATVSQTQTTQEVAQLMNAIATVSQQTSDSSHQVASALQQTVAVARQLQSSVDTFKVNAEV